MPAQLIALAAALSYAISGIAAKRGLRYSTPVTVTLVSVAIHAIVLWIALLIFRGDEAMLYRLLAQAPAYRELQAWSKDGSVRNVEMTLGAVRDPEGRLTHWVAGFADLERLKALAVAA